MHDAADHPTGLITTCSACGYRRALRMDVVPRSGQFRLRCRSCRTLYDDQTADGQPIRWEVHRPRVKEPLFQWSPRPRSHKRSVSAWWFQLLVLALCIAVGIAAAFYRRRPMGAVALSVGPLWLMAGVLGALAWRKEAPWARRVGVLMSSAQLVLSLLALGLGAKVLLLHSEGEPLGAMTDLLLHRRRGAVSFQVFLALLMAWPSARFLLTVPGPGVPTTGRSRLEAVTLATLVAAGLALVALAYLAAFHPIGWFSLFGIAGTACAAVGMAWLAALIPWRGTQPALSRGLAILWLTLALGLVAGWRSASAERAGHLQAAARVMQELNSNCRAARTRVPRISLLPASQRVWLQAMVAPATEEVPRNPILRSLALRWLVRIRPRDIPLEDLNYCSRHFRRYATRRIRKLIRDSE